VYVSDFVIDVVPAQSGVHGGRRSAKSWRATSGADVTRLVVALQKAGYSATRMHAGDARPDSGVQIRGLFAEVDNEIAGDAR